MTRWTVVVEGRAPGDVSEIADPPAARRALIDALGDRDASVGIGARSWTASVDVELEDVTGDVRRVVEIGFGRISAAVTQSGIPAWPIAQIVARRPDLSDLAPGAVLPDVVGIAEATRLANLTRHELAELRVMGRFPRPLVELADSPIWSRASIEEHLAAERSESRPTLPASASNTVRIINSSGALVPKRLGPETTLGPASGPRSTITIRPSSKS